MAKTLFINGHLHKAILNAQSLGIVNRYFLNYFLLEIYTRDSKTSQQLLSNLNIVIQNIEINKRFYFLMCLIKLLGKDWPDKITKLLRER